MTHQSELVCVLGFDVGGANTKTAHVVTSKGKVAEMKTATRYLPLWIKGKESILPAIMETVAGFGKDRVDGVGVTMTAEVCDVFFNKKEGVRYVLECFTKVLPRTPKYVVDVYANLQSVEEAKMKYMQVASANWAASAWMVSQKINNGILMDVGSTTTDIIGILHGEVTAKGRNDLERLTNGELIYSGALRTNIAAIVHSIPLRGQITRVSSEYFASAGDIHLILGNIDEEIYSTETADGRGKSTKEASARLARIVCADTDMLSNNDIVGMAHFIYEAQVEQIANGLKQVANRMKMHENHQFPVVIMGVGGSFIGKKAAYSAGFDRTIGIGELMGVKTADVSPALGVALMVAKKLGP